MANKTKRIQIRISEADLKRIDKQATKANLTRTDFMVAASINKPVVNIEGGQEIAKQLYKLGVNINQIAMLANMGRVKTVYMDEYAREAQKIWQSLNLLTDQTKHISE